MIYVSDKHAEIIKSILEKYPYTFYAYGSRVKGDPRASSDLDLCFKDTIPFNVQSHIEEDFEESALPFQVEIVDFHLMQPEFQKIIEKDLVLISNEFEK